jgi:CheY-like chemotaxis protein
MSCNKKPRLLVVDDDLGVIAAYRLVLEKSPDCRTVENLFGLETLETDLFGEKQPEKQQPEWRITFLDQGVDAVKEVQWAIEDGDPYAAIFLDVRMPPGIDGYDAAELIRKIDSDVHIVVVTGFSDYSYEDFLGIAGPADRLTYMPKPVWPDQLRVVARILAGERKNYRTLLSPLGVVRSA